MAIFKPLRVVDLPRWVDIQKPDGSYEALKTEEALRINPRDFYRRLNSDKKHWPELGKGYAPQIRFEGRQPELRVTFAHDGRGDYTGIVSIVEIKEEKRKTTLGEFGVG